MATDSVPTTEQEQPTKLPAGRSGHCSGPCRGGPLGSLASRRPHVQSGRQQEVQKKLFLYCHATSAPSLEPTHRPTDMPQEQPTRLPAGRSGHC